MDVQLQQEIDLLYKRMCSGIGNPVRIAILYALAERPQYVSELAAELDVPQSTISRHLKILGDHDLVTSSREGAMVYYALADRRIVEGLELFRLALRDRLAKQAQVAEFTMLDAKAGQQQLVDG